MERRDREQGARGHCDRAQAPTLSDPQLHFWPGGHFGLPRGGGGGGGFGGGAVRIVGCVDWNFFDCEVELPLVLLPPVPVPLLLLPLVLEPLVVVPLPAPVPLPVEPLCSRISRCSRPVVVVPGVVVPGVVVVVPPGRPLRSRPVVVVPGVVVVVVVPAGGPLCSLLWPFGETAAIGWPGCAAMTPEPLNCAAVVVAAIVG